MWKIFAAIESVDKTRHILKHKISSYLKWMRFLSVIDYTQSTYESTYAV